MEKLFNGIYKDKKVLITGHTGFKGSWLSYWLSQMGADVVGYSIGQISEPNHFDILNLPMTSVYGDVLDKENIQKTIDKYNPDIIFHLAAQSLVLKSYENPVETFEVNTIGTINILEACRKNKKVKAVINITSDKCYKNIEQNIGYKETDEMGGNDPYSASKGCAEIMIESYRKSFFNIDEYQKSHNTLVASVRAGNVIGGGDWASNRLIPDITKSASEMKVSYIRNIESTRPWQHVLEPLSGYLLLGEKLLNNEVKYANAWNFGPNDDKSLSVGEILKLSKNIWDNIEYEVNNENKIHEANILILNSKKSRDLLQWSSVWKIEKTLEKTIGWYKDYYTEGKINTENDLNDYINNATYSGVCWTK